MWAVLPGYDGNDEELDYASIKNAYNTGSVSGNKNIGGILGLGEYGSVANVYNLGKVSGSADVDAIMGASDTEAVSAVRNAYFLTDSGYQNTVMEQYMLRQQSSIRLSQMGWEKKIKKSGRPIKNRRHRI